MLELATSISLILAAVTVCAVKLIAQIEQNRFSFCKCLDSECTRDMSTPAVVVPTQDIEKRLENLTQDVNPKNNHNFLKNNGWINKKPED